jgi:arylsulfatase A-like enzyme
MDYVLDRRRFLKVAGLSAGAAFLNGGGILSETCQKNFSRPNIVLIMADDMGYSDIGCYGGEIETPNLDKLASNGLRFTQFYNTARCCPTRASLMTGLYPHQAGMGGMVAGKPDPKRSPSYQGYLNDKCVTLAEVLKEAGYTTLMSGKWHVGEFRPHWPIDRGFDKYFGLISGGSNYFDITKAKAKGVVRKMAIDDKPYTPPKEGFYTTDAFTNYAVKLLDKNGRDQKPFFVYVAYTAPHWPLHALPEDIAKYKGKYMVGWDTLRKQRYERMVKMGLIDKDWPLTPRDKKAKSWKDLDDDKKKEMDLKMAVYAAQIDRMDQGIGRILDKLREIDKEKNTLVLFLSDNGGCAEGGIWGFDNRNNGLPPGGVDSYMSYGLSWANASNTPFREYKHWVHEGGVATPLIAHWPGRIKDRNAIRHQVGHVIDVMATFVEIAGAKYPASYKGNDIWPLEGKSLVGAFDNRCIKREAVYFEHEANCAIRKGRWKLVRKHNCKWELYDIEADRTETNNMAEKNPGRVKELAVMWQDWSKRCNVLPLGGRG